MFPKNKLANVNLTTLSLLVKNPKEEHLTNGDSKRQTLIKARRERLDSVRTLLRERENAGVGQVGRNFEKASRKRKIWREEEHCLSVLYA